MRFLRVGVLDVGGFEFGLLGDTSVSSGGRMKAEIVEEVISESRESWLLPSPLFPLLFPLLVLFLPRTSEFHKSPCTSEAGGALRLGALGLGLGMLGFGVFCWMF
jgi:hypothetical protein